MVLSATVLVPSMNVNTPENLKPPRGQCSGTDTPLG